MRKNIGESPCPSCARNLAPRPGDMHYRRIVTGPAAMRLTCSIARVVHQSVLIGDSPHLRLPSQIRVASSRARRQPRGDRARRQPVRGNRGRARRHLLRLGDYSLRPAPLHHRGVRPQRAGLGPLLAGQGVVAAPPHVQRSHRHRALARPLLGHHDDEPVVCIYTYTYTYNIHTHIYIYIHIYIHLFII